MYLLTLAARHIMLEVDIDGLDKARYDLKGA